MKLHRIVVAVDNSAAGRAAARVAAHIAVRSGGELTVLSVAPDVGSGAAGDRPLDLAEAALGGRDFFRDFPTLAVEIAGVYGLPQVEIGRYAEHRKANLVVLGRKERPRAARLFLGDTADAVLRRSPIPCLVVPPGTTELSHALAALDGTERGFMVYEYASAFAETCLMRLSAVTVEPAWSGEPSHLSQSVWSGRTELLATRIENMSRKRPKPSDAGRVCVANELLHVRHGDVVGGVAKEITEGGANVLVLGLHRGGPSLAAASGSVSRTLVHAVPCAVLTVPF